MRAEPEADEQPLCQTVISVTKREGREDKIIICGEPTSWRCNRCFAWVCHEHFETFGGGRLEFCKECAPQVVKKAQEDIWRMEHRHTETVDDAQI